MSKQHLLILIQVILCLISYSNQAQTTRCAVVIYEEMFNSSLFNKEVLQKCNSIYETQIAGPGCFFCSNPHIHNLYDIEETKMISRFCIGTSSKCDTQYEGSDEDGTEFFSTLNSEEYKTNFSAYTPLETNIETEKDTITDFTVSVIKHTKYSLTYSLTSSNPIPLKCYKALDTEQPEFKSTDTYYIIKANTNEKIFTESFPASDYDCKSYKLYLQCFALPYLHDLTHSKSMELLTIEHVENPGDVCEYETGINDEPDYDYEEDDSDPKEPMPSLSTDNPMIDNHEAIMDIKSLPANERGEVFSTYKSSISDTISAKEDIVGKFNEIIKVNEIIDNIKCNTTDDEKECEKNVEKIQSNIWEEIESLFGKNGDKLLKNINEKPFDKEAYDMKVKIVLQTVIVTNNNWKTYNDNTLIKSQKFGITVLNNCLDLIDGLDTSNENYESIKEDIILLLSHSASSMLQTIGLYNQGNEAFDKDEHYHNIYKSIINLSKVYFTEHIPSSSQKHFKYLSNIFKKENETESDSNARNIRRLDDDDEDIMDEYELGNNITLSIPTNYLKNKYKDNNPLGVAVFLFKQYPYFTSQSEGHFIKDVVSLKLITDINTGDNDIQIINVKNIPKKRAVNTTYSGRSLINSTFNKCYTFNYDVNRVPREKNIYKKKTANETVSCFSSNFDDVLYGNFSDNSLQYWEIIVIVIAIICVLLDVFLLVYWLMCSKNSNKQVVNNYDNEMSKQKSTIDSCRAYNFTAADKISVTSRVKDREGKE